MSKGAGYILLELLIASAISSFVLAALFTIFNQTNQVVERVDRITSIDMRALLVHNQMERDFSGAFVPYMRKQKAASSQKTGASVGQSMRSTGTAAKQSAGQSKFEEVPLIKAFYGKQSGENIQELTCITTNPIPSFDVIKPRIARVVYTVVPDRTPALKGEKEKTFRLLRQEDISLDYAAFGKEGGKKIRAYEVIKNIKSFSIEYTVMIKPEPPKKAPSGKDNTASSKTAGAAAAIGKGAEAVDKDKVQYKTFKQWTDEEIKTSKKQKPDLCLCKLQLWDDLRRTVKSFEFKIYMPLQEQKSEKKKAEQKQAAEKKGPKGKKDATKSGQADQKTQQTVKTSINVASTKIPKVTRADIKALLTGVV